MDNEKKAIQNQKVFVRLQQILEIQKEIERLAADNPTVQGRFFIKGLVRALDILEIPYSLSPAAKSGALL